MQLIERLQGLCYRNSVESTMNNMEQLFRLYAVYPGS